MVTACAVVRIESINWLLHRSNFHNIRIIHNKRQTPPDRLLDKSTVSETQEESRNESIDASALLIGLRNCESWFEHRPGPPVNQQVYLTHTLSQNYLPGFKWGSNRGAYCLRQICKCVIYITDNEFIVETVVNNVQIID